MTEAFSTYEDFSKAVDRMMAPLRERILASDGAGLLLGHTGAVYDEKHAEMEGLIRPLWGLAPLWLYRDDVELREAYLKKIRQGVDPTSPYYWGDVTKYDQYIVEMAALSVALLLQPKLIWDELGDEAQNNLVVWLKQALDKRIPQNNWTFFKVLIRTALYCRTDEIDYSMLQEEIDLIETMYESDGWYHDGKNNQKDYYIPFAFHYYGLLFSVFMKKEMPEVCKRYQDRAREFWKEYQRFFDDSGAAIPFGRSLTYRFAQGSFLSALIFADVPQINWGTVKYVLQRHMKSWWQKNMWTIDGRLSIGYYYENLLMAEGYNSPGSPYWAMKTFLLLAVPKTHPFWTVSAEKPVLNSRASEVGNGSFVIANPQQNSHATLLPINVTLKGQAHALAKYEKFIYDSKFGFSVAKGAARYEEMGLDNVLAVEINGIFYLPNSQNSHRYAVNNKVICEWNPIEGIQIKTTILLGESGHSRRHEIQTNQHLTLYDAGACVPNDEQLQITTDELRVTAKNASLQSAAESKQPFSDVVLYYMEPNTSLFFPRTVMPVVKSTIEPGAMVIMNNFDMSVEHGGNF